MLVTMFEQATTGRYGPVWMDVPIDIQSQRVGDVISYQNQDQDVDKIDIIDTSTFCIPQIIEKICNASRPVIIAGTGIRISNTTVELREVAETLQVPVCTAWT